MVARGCSPGPLFFWEDKWFLTRELFVAALSAAGYAAKDYAGHSFRIGAVNGVRVSKALSLRHWAIGRVLRICVISERLPRCYSGWQRPSLGHGTGVHRRHFHCCIHFCSITIVYITNHNLFAWAHQKYAYS